MSGGPGSSRGLGDQAVGLPIAEARHTAEHALTRLGYDAGDARAIADHLIDCELRGLGMSGLARVLSVAERLDGARPVGSGQLHVTRETPASAHLEAHDAIGYLAAQRVTEIALAKARVTGLAAVATSGTWYTGMLSYYAEQVTAAGFAVMIASNASPWVAPAGSTEARLGTNPICFGFPGSPATTGAASDAPAPGGPAPGAGPDSAPGAARPIIWDIGTSEIIHADVVLARRRGDDLPAGTAYDATGAPTLDPSAALGGALVGWGGHRGGGLGLVVQLLGALAGSPALPGELRDFGLLMVVLSPELFGDARTFARTADELAAAVRGARPADPGRPVRLPFDRSRAERERRRAEGVIHVERLVLDRLAAL